MPRTGRDAATERPLEFLDCSALASGLSELLVSSEQ